MRAAPNYRLDDKYELCGGDRIRADVSRPTCNNCKKGNRPCPGYCHNLKFQDEGARLRNRYEGTDTSTVTPFDSSQESDESPPALTPTTSVNRSRRVSTPAIRSIDNGSSILPPIGLDGNNWDIVGLDMCTTERRTFLGLLEGKSKAYAKLAESMPEMSGLNYGADFDDLRFAPSAERFMFTSLNEPVAPLYEHISAPDMAQKQLLTKFKESLFPDNQSLPQAFRNHSRWLSHLPPLTGTNALLDAAVKAVTLVHIGRLNNSEPFVMESRPYYGQALTLLNKVLQDKTAGLSNETLCAVILLSFYEMLASDNNESWVRHAGGVSALMRARGPKRHRHGFDCEIFLAYRFTLIIEAFEGDMPCFLAEPEWLKLSSEIHGDLKASGVSNARIEIFDLAEEYYASMVVLPELCAHARALWQARQNNTPCPYNRAQLIDKVSQHRAQFKSTFARLEAALKRAGHAPTIKINDKEPVVAIEYEYINTFVSATYTGYWTVLIVLNLSLQALHADDKEMVAMYHTESRNCGLNVCRSSAYMLTSSFLGPFFLIFGLRVGLLVFEETDGPEADWILRKLFHIGDRHMGIAKHVPGYRAGITVEQLIAESKERKARSKQKQDTSEDMEFVPQIAYGQISGQDNSQNTGPTVFNRGAAAHASECTSQNVHFSNSWQGLTKIDDVLNAWGKQNNFQLQQNLDQLNVKTSEYPLSTGHSPMPTSDPMQKQDLFQAATAFAMPDMNFVDTGYPEPNLSFDNTFSADPYIHDPTFDAALM